MKHSLVFVLIVSLALQLLSYLESMRVVNRNLRSMNHLTAKLLCHDIGDIQT